MTWIFDFCVNIFVLVQFLWYRNICVSGRKLKLCLSQKQDIFIGKIMEDFEILSASSQVNQNCILKQVGIHSFSFSAV